MTTIPHPPTDPGPRGGLPVSRVRPFRAISGAVSVAVVFAVVEVLYRYFSAERPFGPAQLTLAVASNVALLGTAAVAVLLIGALLGWLASIPVRSYRQTIQSALIAGGAGTLAGLLGYWTRAWDVSVVWDHAAVIPTVSVAVGAIVAVAVWQLGLSMRPSLMNLTRAAVVGAWMCCTAASVASAVRTDEYVKQWATSSAHADETAPMETGEDRPNLMLIVLDTLRADRVGVYGDSELTPHLDRFAASSIVFEQAISTAPWTLPAHASFLTGLYPAEHGVSWGHYRLGDGPPMLPELLQARGYDSFAISNNHLLNEANGFARGFDGFLETTVDPTISPWKLALRSGAAGWLAPWIGLSADAGWDQGSAWTNWLLARRFAWRGDADRPFFAMVNYFEPHDPYQPPRRFLERHLTRPERRAAGKLAQSEEHLAVHACGRQGVFDEQEIELLAKLYDADVAYQDEAFGDFVRILEAHGLLENTWVVVASDHGELFGEQDMVYHTAGAHFQLLHIPLLVRPPGTTGLDSDQGGAKAMRRVSAPVQPVDVFVTMLELAGAAVPSTVSRAYPLPLEPDAVPQRTVCVSQTHGASIAGLSITQRHSLQTDVSSWLRWIDSVYVDGFLLEVDSQGGQALYNVAEDPAMVTDLTGTRQERLRTMLAELEHWRGGNLAESGENHESPKHAAASVR